MDNQDNPPYKGGCCPCLSWHCPTVQDRLDKPQLSNRCPRVVQVVQVASRIAEVGIEKLDMVLAVFANHQETAIAHKPVDCARPVLAA